MLELTEDKVLWLHFVKMVTTFGFHKSNGLSSPDFKEDLVPWRYFLVNKLVRYRHPHHAHSAAGENFSLHHHFQTSSGAHSAFPMGTGDSFLGDKVAGV